jgi:hypothetical protein
MKTTIVGIGIVIISFIIILCCMRIRIYNDAKIELNEVHSKEIERLEKRIAELEKAQKH